MQSINGMKKVLLLGLLVLFIFTISNAQAFNQRIAGQVKDEMGRTISGMKDALLTVIGHAKRKIVIENQRELIMHERIGEERRFLNLKRTGKLRECVIIKKMN